MKTLLCIGLLAVLIPPARAHDPYYDYGSDPYQTPPFSEGYPALLPVIYEAPVVYHAPVVYDAPVIYYGPVYYFSAPEPWPHYSGYERNYSAASTVTVIGGKSGPYSYSNFGSHCGSTVVHLSGRRHGF